MTKTKKEPNGWLSEESVRKRLGGFINAELQIMETKPKKMIEELEHAVSEMKRQFKGKSK
jgi:hypothetical protein